MKTRRLVITISLLLIVVGIAITGVAQKNRPAPTPKRTSGPSLLAALPQSDAVGTVNVRQLLNEAVPKIFAESPAKLAEVNVELDKFKTKTGIDPHLFEEVALSMRYTYPAEGIAKIESVVLARGTFNTATIVAAGRQTANGMYREEKYQGHSIYVFTLNQQVKVLGLLNLKLNDLAVTSLSGTVLALGTPATVKTAIDASKGPRGLNQELIALATRDPNAVVGFGGNVTPQLIKSMRVSNDAVLEDVAKIRQVYGSVGVTDKDVEMFLAARTLNAESAKSLSSTLETLKQLGALYAGVLPAAKGALARAALGNLKITTIGNELQLRTAVAQAQLAPLMRGE
ncbi:MAG: hypothetical protein M3R68_00890 [Acidobacteriota bacterium]|nr:hypothetical protein [Acidobacteriota bacterium]